MLLLQRMVGVAWDCRPWRGDDAVVLCHVPSGLVLLAAPDSEEPVQFRSHAAAGQFRARFLDEPDAWESRRASGHAACAA
jgi:hypothetical protein